MMKFVLLVGMLLTNGQYTVYGDRAEEFVTYEDCNRAQLQLVSQNRELVLDDGRLVIVCAPKQ